MALDANTIVMLHFDSSVTQDEKNHTFVGSGNPQLILGKFNSAAYLDASSSIYMEEDLDILSSDFTIDFWLKFFDSTPDASTAYLLAFGSEEDEKLFQFSLKLVANGGMTVFVGTDNPLHSNILSHSELVALGANTWFHLSFVYNKTANSLAVYVNGNLKTTITGDSIGATLDELYEEYQVGTLVAHGIDEFRISNTKRWTESTNPPPTEPYGEEEVTKTNYRHTKAWLNFTTDANTDEIGNRWGINGNFTVSTVNAKFGNALQCTGSNNFIQMQDNIYLGNNNFLIDFYTCINNDATNNTNKYVFYMKNTTSNHEIYLKIAGSLQCQAKVGASTASATNITITKGSVVHVAYEYNVYAKEAYVFVNNSKVATFTGVTFTDYTNWVVAVGGYNASPLTDSTSYSFVGTVDDFKIMVGRTTKDNNSFISSASSGTQYVLANNDAVVNQDSSTKIMMFNDVSNPMYDDCGNRFIQRGGNIKAEVINNVSSDTCFVNSSISPYNYIYQSDTTTLTMGNAGFTIDFWTQADPVGKANQVLFELTNGTTADAITLTTATNSNATATYLALSKGTTSNQDTSSNNNIISGALKHVAIEYDYTNKKLLLFVNGTNTITLSSINFSSTTGWTLSLFNSKANVSISKSYTGKIDQFRISTGVNRFSTSSAFTAPTRTARTYVVDGIYSPPDYPIQTAVKIPLRLY